MTKRPYSPGCLGEPALDSALKILDRLHPIAEVRVGSREAAFAFRAPVPWPLFARLDIAKPFAARAQELASKVGARAVESFSIGEGAMRVRIL